MRLSLSWIVLVIFVLLFLLLGVQGKKVYEAFTEKDKKEEGFTSSQVDDIILTSCPAGTKGYVDDLGNTVCCQGEIENGKCKGREVCSITTNQSKYPTCGRYWAAVLEERGRDRCPVVMPNYYENMKTGVKGCAQGRRTADGSAPLPGVKFCRLYNSKQEDEQRTDSCFNQNLLEKTVCFPTNTNIQVRKQLTIKPGGDTAIVQCVYTNQGRSGTCVPNDQLNRYYKELVRKGRASSRYATDLEPYDKMEACNEQKKVAIDKTMRIEDLRYVNIETGAYTPPPPPPPRPVSPPPRPFIAPPPPPPPRAPVLRRIGGENQTLYVPPNTTVRYGARGQYVTKKVSGWFRATNQFFGRDPIPGVFKEVLQET